VQEYLVCRRRLWRTEEELAADLDCAPAIIALFEPDLRWARSCVVHEDDGTLSAYCIYEATSRDVVEAYVEASGWPAEFIRLVASTAVAEPVSLPA
jgi:hypothetical protein